MKEPSKARLSIVTNATRNTSATLLRLLVYGMPGSGKTYLIGSAALNPVTSPVLYLELNGQSQSLASLDLPDDQFMHILVKEYNTFSHMLTWLRNPVSRPDITELIEDTTQVKGWFPKTVGIDSVTEIQRREVLRVAGNTLNDGVLPTDFIRPEIQQWGELLDQFILFGERYYKPPFHVIMTCLEETDQDVKNKIERRLPALHGKARELFSSTALTVMRMAQVPAGTFTEQWGHREEVYCKGYLRSTDGRDFARDNTGVFPAVLYNPTAPRMAQMLANACKAKAKAKIDMENGSGNN
jgi:hypothetical protein